jgi:CheY-like chemotaxis protein
VADRILIVDDTDTVLDYLDLVFAKSGFETLRARGGAQALALAQEQLPDLALVDVMMPDIDGFEVCRRLRADPTTSRLPIFLYSAIVGQEVRAQAHAAGADEFLGKSLHHAELVERVRDWLATRSLPGAVGEPAMLQLALDLVALFEVEVVWLLTQQAGAWRTGALASERGEQQARRLLEAAGEPAKVGLGLAPQASLVRRISLEELIAAPGCQKLATALAGINALGAIVAPLAPEGELVGLLVASAPAALATSGPAAQRMVIGLRYATLALERME